MSGMIGADLAAKECVCRASKVMSKKDIVRPLLYFNMIKTKLTELRTCVARAKLKQICSWQSHSKRRQTHLLHRRKSKANIHSNTPSRCKRLSLEALSQRASCRV